ncbi:hypothetical protein D9M70_452020 [compost metagenome]
MAGDWIKMRTALADDPAVICMADRLGMDEFSVVGRLHHLWSWADKQSRDGHASGVTGKWIDRYVQCDGFAQCLVSVGWLVLGENGIEFPNFDRHNGETAKARGLATNRQQKKRAGVTPPKEQPSRNQRDNGVTREEKSNNSLSDAREPVVDGAPFEMFLEWTPDERKLKAMAFRAGLAMDLFTAEGIAGFVIHHSATHVPKSEDEWLAALVGWRARDKANAAGKVTPIRAGSSGEVDFETTGWLGRAH